jgi:DNA-binding transcriptional ArsR family regulator
LDGGLGRDPFKALGDSTRRRIVEALSTGEQPVEAIVDRLGSDYRIVSQHLQVLLSAGLVERRAEGRRRIYRLRGEALGELTGWLEQQRKAWEHAMNRLEQFLDHRS